MNIALLCVGIEMLNLWLQFLPDFLIESLFLYHHFKTLADVLQFQDNYEILYNLSYFTRLVSLRL